MREFSLLDYLREAEGSVLVTRVAGAYSVTGGHRSLDLRDLVDQQPLLPFPRRLQRDGRMIVGCRDLRCLRSLCYQLNSS